MAQKDMQAVLKLRRDSENNFTRSNIVLQEGELALVTRPFAGIQVKVGNGSDRFNDLPYANFGLLVKGFLVNDTKFVRTDNVTEVNPTEHILFLDGNTGFLYYWDPGKEGLNPRPARYVYVKQDEVPAATDAVAGIMKLYNDLNGSNTDGAVTQAAVNTAMRRIQNAANGVVFEMDTEDTEKLNADLSPLGALQILD